MSKIDWMAENGKNVEKNTQLEAPQSKKSKWGILWVSLFLAISLVSFIMIMTPNKNENIETEPIPFNPIEDINRGYVKEYIEEEQTAKIINPEVNY